MRLRRYPSKNTVRLQAEIERLTGERARFSHPSSVVELRVGEQRWTTGVLPSGGVRSAISAADFDAAKRHLLVLARRELSEAANQPGVPVVTGLWFAALRDLYLRLESTLRGRAIIAGMAISLAVVIVVLRFTVFA